MKKFRIKLASFAISIFAALFIAVPSAHAATSINITSPNTTTVTSSSFTVSGTATPNRSVEITVNGLAAASTTSDSDGNWSADLTDQEPGEKTIKATASGQQLYANVLNVGSMTSRMARFNPITGAEESAIEVPTVGSFPITWRPNPSFTKAYGVAPYLNLGTVWVTDLITGAVTTFTLPGVNPRGAALAYNADGSKVYITDNENTTVYVYNTNDNSLSGSSLAVGNAPHSNLYRPNNDEIWVLNSADSTISVISTISGTIVNEYNTVGTCNGLTFSPDGSIAYVGIESGAIEVLNAETGAHIATITGTASVPEYLVINPAGTRVYVSQPLSNTVDVFNVETNSLETTLTTPTGPWGMAFNADGSKIYITSPNLTGPLSGTTITAFNTATNTLDSTINVTGGAPFITFMSPVESASDEVTFTVEAGLAETGVSTFVQTFFALTLIAGAALAAHKSRTQRFAVSRTGFKAKRR